VCSCDDVDSFRELFEACDWLILPGGMTRVRYVPFNNRGYICIAASKSECHKWPVTARWSSGTSMVCGFFSVTYCVSIRYESLRGDRSVVLEFMRCLVVRDG
jgi:hypothetical protein